MLKPNEKMKKGAANKARKRAATAKNIPPLVASFFISKEGDKRHKQEIQEQKPFKDFDLIEAEREVLADKHGLLVKNIEVKLIDNRTRKEKKEAAASPPALGKSATIDGVGRVHPSGDYEPISNEQRLKNYDRITEAIEEHEEAEGALKTKHKKEMDAWKERDTNLKGDLKANRVREPKPGKPVQTDVFKDRDGLQAVKFTHKGVDLTPFTDYKNLDAATAALKKVSQGKKIKKGEIQAIQQQKEKAGGDIKEQDISIIFESNKKPPAKKKN